VTIREVVSIIYFFLPAGVANMTPVLLTKIFGDGPPVSVRRFGSHKTWRGLIGGVAAGVAFFAVQRAIDHLPFPLVVGALMSAGALLGDLLKSFFKRLRRVPPGETWFPFDQIDYIVGAIAMTLIVVPLTPSEIAIAFVSYFLLHLVVSATGWLLALKDRPF